MIVLISDEDDVKNVAGGCLVEGRWPDFNSLMDALMAGWKDGGMDGGLSTTVT